MKRTNGIKSISRTSREAHQQKYRSQSHLPFPSYKWMDRIIEKKTSHILTIKMAGRHNLKL